MKRILGYISLRVESHFDSQEGATLLRRAFKTHPTQDRTRRPKTSRVDSGVTIGGGTDRPGWHHSGVTPEWN